MLCVVSELWEIGALRVTAGDLGHHHEVILVVFEWGFIKGYLKRWIWLTSKSNYRIYCRKLPFKIMHGHVPVGISSNHGQPKSMWQSGNLLIYLRIYFWIEDRRPELSRQWEVSVSAERTRWRSCITGAKSVSSQWPTQVALKNRRSLCAQICFPLTSTDSTVAHKSFLTILLCSPPCSGWNKGCLCALPKLAGRWENCGPLRSFCPIVFTFQNGRLSLTKPNIWHKRTRMVGGPVISSLSVFFFL